MRLLVTGAEGLLGSALQDVIGKLEWQSSRFQRQPFWSASPSDRVALVSGYDWVIHAAANTNVEACEGDPAGCYQDNYLLTDLLAQTCAIAGVRLAFISSTGIYGTHKSEPYLEYDSVMPTTHHHRSKWLAEQSVLAASPENLILRTGWLFGGAIGNPKNFVARRIEEGLKAQRQGSVIFSNDQQRGVPCFNLEIAERTVNLIADGHAGVFNCVNSGSASRFEYVSKILQFAGIDAEIRPATPETFNRIALVSDNEMAENWKMACLGFPAMPAWDVGLQNYVELVLPLILEFGHS